MSAFPWLSALTALPVVGAILAVATGRNKAAARTVSLAFGFASLAVTLLLWHSFGPSSGQLQFQEIHSWVPALGMEYRVGIDGIGLVMLLLTSIALPMAVLASTQVAENANIYFALMLVLQACLFGTFTALNFLHWFLYWELALVPAFFLIKLWGGNRSGAAAMQFLLYTMAGSIAMLLAFIALFLSLHTFNFGDLARLSQNGQLMPAIAATFGDHRALPVLIFLGTFLAFAVKVPLVPFHVWQPNAYAEAPTGVTILLTSAMSKMGVYGFLRVLLPIFAPQMRQASTALLALAVLTIVSSAYSALAQTNLKRIFAYSSINHLGYCLLGIFAVARLSGSDPSLIAAKHAALDGVILQMLNHALTAGTLFWFVAMLEQRSGGLHGLHDFGGLRKVVPVFTGLMGIAIFSSLGLPGLNGFISEFLIFRGAFPLASWATAASLLGLLVTAIFLLGILQRVFFGPLNSRWQAMADLSTAARWSLAPMIAFMFALGLYPQIILGTINQTVVQLVRGLGF